MKGYGMKDGSKYGLKKGGRGLNKIDVCRHPELVDDEQDTTAKKAIKKILG